MKKYDFIIITDSLSQIENNYIKNIFNIIKDLTGFNCILNPVKIDTTIYCNILLYFANDDVKIYQIDKNIKFNNVSFINIITDLRIVNERNITLEMISCSILNELFCKSGRLKMMSCNIHSYPSFRTDREYTFKNGILCIDTDTDYHTKLYTIFNKKDKINMTKHFDDISASNLKLLYPNLIKG